MIPLAAMALAAMIPLTVGPSSSEVMSLASGLLDNNMQGYTICSDPVGNTG